MADKYYVGFYDGNTLIAVLDLIISFPDKGTAYIGFFMMNTDVQNGGIGSAIISDLCPFLKQIGMDEVRLGWVQGNPQAEHFWKKNGFVETGITNETEDYIVVIARKEI